MREMVFRCNSAGSLGCLLYAWALTGPGLALAAVQSMEPVRVAGADATQNSPQLNPSRAFVRFAELTPRLDAPPVPAEIAPLPERAAEPIASSRKLIGEQRYTEAALELERALRYARDHWEIHAQLAMLHWQAGNLERARSSALKTVESNPQAVIGRYILGRCLSTVGKRSEAISELRLALLCREFEKDPEIAALVHFHLAEMLSAEGFLSAAIEQYEAFGNAAARATPAARGELASLLATRRGSMEQAKADMLEKLGRHDEAAAILRLSAEKSPQDMALQVRYVKLLLAANKSDEAAAVLAGVVSDDDQILDQLAELRRKSNQPQLLVDDLRARAKVFPNSANVANRLAKALHENGRSDEGYAVLADYLTRNPPNAAIRQTQLDILVKSKRWKDALKLTAEKLQADPSSERDVQAIIEAVRGAPGAAADIIASASEAQSDKWHLYLIGALAADAQRFEQAEQLFRDALALDPKMIPARAALGELYLRKCDFAGALRVVSRSDDDAPEDARLERVLGQTYDRLDDLERAEVHFRAAIQLDRSDVRSMYSLANVYRRTKKALQAQHQLRALLDLRQTHEPAREMMALLLLEEGKRDAARQEYILLEKMTSKATTKVRCRILLDEALVKNPEERRRLLLEAIEQTQPDAAAYAAVAESYEDTDPEKAREYYTKAVELDPDDEDSLLGILRSHQHQLEFDKVTAGLEELLRCRPNRHSWRRTLAGMYSLLEQFDRGIALLEEFESRGDLDPNRKAEYRETLVESLRESGQRDEAIARLRTWAADEPGGGPWTIRLAQEQYRQRRFEDAIQTYTALMGLSPDNKGIRDRLLEALLEARQFVRAEQYVVEWFAEDPQNDRLVLALAQVVSRAGRVDEAVNLLETWLSKTPRRELFQNTLVSIYATAGRYDDCADLLEELADEIMGLIHAGGDQGRLPADHAISEDRRSRLPNEPFSVDRLHDRFEDLRAARITALGNAKEFEKAQKLLDEMLEASPDPMLRLSLQARQQVALYRLQGREDEAVGVLQSALELRTNTESLNNDIAYSWIDRGIKLEEADTLIRYSLGRIPRQAAYLDTYGWLLYKKGDMEGARLWLSRANRVRGGDDPVIHDHLGDALWRMGRKDEAIRQWEVAVELIEDRTEHELSNDDERRVARVTRQKIEDARSGTEPKIAGLGGESVPEPRP